MAIALLSVGLLGLLVFLLGLNVSRERRSVILTQHEAEADPASGLRKAIRAHGNCIEYVPMLSLMILALGLRSPILPTWTSILIIAAVAARYIHAVSIITSESIYQPTALKFVGAAGTYLAGSVLAIILIVQALSLF
ncbi:MAG: MAPEG family protein [Pseudomonadota bacterium]